MKMRDNLILKNCFSFPKVYFKVYREKSVHAIVIFLAFIIGSEYNEWLVFFSFSPLLDYNEKLQYKKPSIIDSTCARSWSDVFPTLRLRFGEKQKAKSYTHKIINLRLLLKNIIIRWRKSVIGS